MSGHQPVLVKQALDGLALIDGGWYVDATYGRGGHSAEILARIGPHGQLLALDKDPQAVADAQRRFAGDKRFTIKHAAFEDWDAVVAPWLGERSLAGALFDLGVSSPQLEDPSRGFSFARDGPLDMRMNTNRGPTAAQWLADVGQAELIDTLRRYGEEPRARQIAAAIVRARAQAPLETTAQLARVVAQAAGYRRGRTHPATRVFQAIRIAVNDELVALERALRACLATLGDRGRLVVISFHSLEDRIVKRFMAREARGDPAYAGLPNVPREARPKLELIGRLIRPTEDEIAANPRARSARLRVAARIHAEPGNAG
jgi:16S rRNA (cytosine1402-N4)-methyltransferase